MDEQERRRLMQERHQLQSDEARRKEARREQMREDDRKFRRDQEKEKLQAREHQIQQKQEADLEKLHAQHALQPEALENAFEDQKRRDYLRHLLSEFTKNNELEREKELISHEREWNLVEAAFMAKLNSKQGDGDLSDSDLKSLIKDVLTHKGI